MTITYEDVLANRNETLASIYDFLGVEHFYPDSDIYKKMTSDSLSEGIENYEEVMSWIGGTKFLRF